MLHDLDQVARLAHHVIAMRDGSVVASGAPGQVVTSEVVPYT